MLFSSSRNLMSFINKVYITRLFSQTVTKDLLYDKLKSLDNGIAIIGLNRPKANTLSFSLVNVFENTLESIENDKEVRVAIIRSHIPNIFCAGADLKERLMLSPEETEKFVNRLRSLFTRVNNLPVPVIAALDGVAFGGGLELALSCDIRITSTINKLGLVETRLGIIPGAGGTQRLPRTINTSLAKELIYTAKVINGEEAEKYGLVNYAVKQNENGDAAYLKALDLARDILPNGPFAVKMAKKAINKGLDVDLDAALKYEEKCYAKLIPTKDRIEGVKAYNEKRSPNYIGE